MAMVNGGMTMTGMTPADGIVTSTEIDVITTLLLSDPNVTALFQEEDQQALANLTAELPTLLNDFLGVNDTHGITKDEMALALDTLLVGVIDDDESGDLNRAEMQAALDLIVPLLGAAADGVMQALQDAIDSFDVAAMMGGGGGGMDPSAWGRRRLADDAAPVRMAVDAQGAKVRGAGGGAHRGGEGRRRQGARALDARRGAARRRRWSPSTRRRRRRSRAPRPTS